MTDFAYNLENVHRITADAVGAPGQRVFYMQARRGTELLSLLAEKEQVHALAQAIDKLLDELTEKNPNLTTSDDLIVMDMRLEQPIEPAFRIAHMGLGYDEEHDRVVLVIQGQESAEAEGTVLARISATRSQMRSLSTHAVRVVAAGRPTCLQYPRPCDYRRGDICMFCPDLN
jgi:uncharacterized repeat protein (TIGR03847 family)